MLCLPSKYTHNWNILYLPVKKWYHEINVILQNVGVRCKITLLTTIWKWCVMKQCAGYFLLPLYILFVPFSFLSWALETHLCELNQQVTLPAGLLPLRSKSRWEGGGDGKQSKAGYRFIFCAPSLPGHYKPAAFSSAFSIYVTLSLFL